jgi:hypothetical protein
MKTTFQLFIKENTEENNIYFITYGCGGGINDINHELFYGTQTEADRYAWQCACETYDNYAGMHGIQDRDDIAEEMVENGEYDSVDDVPDDEIEQAFSDERESWLNYNAEIFDENNEEQIGDLENSKFDWKNFIDTYK